MLNKLQYIIEKLIQNPKKLFLIDSVGAFLTSFLLYIILSRFDVYFGIPKHILCLLSFIALLFSIYSISCYFFVVNNYRLFLKIIAIANAMYCVLTAIILVIYYEQLKFADFIYFIPEIVIICSLITIEKKALLR